MKAILIDGIQKIDATETKILRYLSRELTEGGQRIDYARAARVLNMTYQAFSKGVDRLVAGGIIKKYDGALYLGASIVDL